MSFDFNNNTLEDNQIDANIYLAAKFAHINGMLKQFHCRLKYNADVPLTLELLHPITDNTRKCADWLTSIFNILYEELGTNGVITVRNNLLVDCKYKPRISTYFNLCSDICEKYVESEIWDNYPTVRYINPDWYFNYIRFIASMYDEHDHMSVSLFDELFPSRTPNIIIKNCQNIAYDVVFTPTDSIKYVLSPANMHELHNYVLEHKELCSQLIVRPVKAFNIIKFIRIIAPIYDEKRIKAAYANNPYYDIMCDNVYDIYVELNEFLRNK